MDVPNAITKSQNIFNDKSFNVKFNDSSSKLNDSEWLDIIYNTERLSISKEQKNKNTKELEKKLILLQEKYKEMKRKDETKEEELEKLRQQIEHYKTEIDEMKDIQQFEVINV